LKDAKIIEADVMEFFNVEEWKPLGLSMLK